MYKRNLLANYVGTACAASLGLLFVPVYISYLGLEAYGLIGTFVILQTVVGLVETVLSTVLIRELGRYRSGCATTREASALCWSLFWGQAGLFLILASLLVSLSPLIARAYAAGSPWNADELTVPVVTLGLSSLLRLFESYYRGILTGFELQVRMNVILCSTALIRSAGGAGVLVFGDATLVGFCCWQLLITCLSLIAYGAACRNTTPRSSVVRGDVKGCFRSHWRFGSGVLVLSSSTSLMAITGQSVLVAVLSLEQYGVFSMASSISGVFGLISNPTGQALYARVASLVGGGGRLAIIGTIRSTTQVLAVLVGSVGATFALLPERLIMAWTGRPALARETASIVGLLCIAAAANAFTVVPYRLRLAIGSTRFWIVANTMAAAVSVSGYLIAGSSFGLWGIATVAIVVNVTLVAIICPISLSPTLGNQSWGWLLSDILVPVSGASVAVIGVSSASTRLADSRLQSAAAVVAGLCAALIASVACAARVRGAIASQARSAWASFR